jgi:hypothetical protein
MCHICSTAAIVDASSPRERVNRLCASKFDRNVQRFRGGFVFKGSKTFVSLNSMLESNNEAEEGLENNATMPEVDGLEPLPRQS